MTSRLWMGALLALAWSHPQAHSLSVSHLQVVAPDQGGDLQVELDLALRDVALTLPLDANRDERVTWGELRAIRPALESMVLAGVWIASRGGPCSLRPVALATRNYEDGTYATLRLRARCPSSEDLEVGYRLFFDRDPSHRSVVTVQRGAITDTAIARRDAPTVRFGSSGTSPFAGFLREGIHHILIGNDHLAFLLCLLLPAVLIRSRGGWEAASERRGPLLHVLGIVTAFTLAHSITLSLAALELVTPASRWVEVSIALSVLLAALNNLKPMVTRRLWLAGFVFGLIHGFGFAGALAELGLPHQSRLGALLGFNIGVELGQVLVVCVLMPVLFLVRHRPWYSRIAMPAMSLAIAALAACWMTERIAG